MVALRNKTDGSFCFFFQKEVLFFFEKKNQKLPDLDLR